MFLLRMKCLEESMFGNKLEYVLQTSLKIDLQVNAHTKQKEVLFNRTLIGIHGY